MRELRTYTYTSGKKSNYRNLRSGFVVCHPEESDIAYNALRNQLVLYDESDRADFQMAQEDEDVETLLTDMKWRGFIGEWKEDFE